MLLEQIFLKNVNLGRGHFIKDNFIKGKLIRNFSSKENSKGTFHQELFKRENSKGTFHQFHQFEFYEVFRCQ